ncbi:MAG: zinc-ribbon domain-containing protein [Ruminococcaceae bacterium]|nr:zinc-ribbon domain-containing protein [Oscillospiraceae bacterium]
MICSHCGKEIPDGSKFCIKCGANLTAPATDEPVVVDNQNAQPEPDVVDNQYSQPVAEPAYAPQPSAPVYQNAAPVVSQVAPQPVMTPQQPAKAKKPVNKKLIGIIAAAVVVVAVAIVCLVLFTGKVNSENYFTDSPKFTGYDGYGSVDLESVYDFEALEDALGGFDGKDMDDMLEDSKYFKVSCKPSENLKNGDEITVTIKINYEKVNKQKPKKKLVGEDKITKTFTVEGLTPVAKIDPFKVIKSVTYDATGYYSETELVYDTGYSEKINDSISVEYGEQSLNIKTKDETITVYYSYDSESYESTGKIKVTANAYYDDFETAEYGFVLDSTEKEFEPTTVDFLTSKDTINKDDLDKIKELADEEMKSDYSSESPKYVKAIFAYEGDYGDSNAMYFVYSYKDSWENKTRYTYAYATNFKITSDGDITGIDDMYYTTSYYGYDSVKELEKNLKESWKTVTQEQ